MSQNPNFIQATLTHGNYVFNISLSILVWEDDGIHYIYSPALDLTGYGTSSVEAQESFEIMLDEFVRYTENKKTIYQELERLGWTVNKKKKRVHPPEKEQMLQDNETYRNLIEMPGVIHRSTNVGLTLA